MIACLATGWRGIRNLRYFVEPEFIVIPKVECQLLLGRKRENRLLQFHRKPDEKQLQQKQRKNKFDRLVHRKSSHSQSFAHIRIDASLYISSYRSRMQSILPWYFHSCNFLQFTSLPFVRSPHKICPHSGKERGCCSLCRSSSLPPRQLLTKQPVTVAIPVQHSAASGGKASLSAALGIKLDQFKTV